MTLSKMIAILLFWIFFAIVVFLIALSMGLYSHSLIRVRKKIRLSAKSAFSLKSEIEGELGRKTKELALLKQAIVRLKHSIRLLDVYLYDEREPSTKAQDGRDLILSALGDYEKAEKLISHSDKKEILSLLDSALDKSEKARGVFLSIVQEEQKGKKRGL